MKEAYLYKKLKDNLVQCHICSHFCTLKPDTVGKCGVRKNRGGKLMVLNYGQTTGLAIDPIEKKPLFHFMPGTKTLSFGTVGCNFFCQHCQNWMTSQAAPETCPERSDSGAEGPREYYTEYIKPEEIVTAARDNNCPSISYTYNEPTVFLEYALDTMKLGRKNKLKNIWVSNGFMSEETLELILPYLGAINVDLKSFREEFYREICGARLEPVLENLKKLARSKVHLEVTTLIIPTKNDSVEELRGIAKFIKKELGDNVPWHVTAFYPTYKLQNLPATSREKVMEAKSIGEEEGLKFVYTGNIW